MAFICYYVGVNGKGYNFYSKLELMDFLKTPNIFLEASRDNITIFKENDKSRISYSFKDGTLTKNYTERMVDGAYGN